MQSFLVDRTFDKNEVKKLLYWFARNYGSIGTIMLLEKLKILGFQQSTKAGLSFSIDDLLIPDNKGTLLKNASYEVDCNTYRANQLTGSISSLQRFTRVTDVWTTTSDLLKNEVLEHFSETDPLNPVYMMACSGARGNISQVRQLVGMRGLMSDAQGNVMEYPIKSNFREGLSTTEYFISCYGARKGLVDTALRTADAGYLTRRLIETARSVTIKGLDCYTKQYILISSLKDKENKTKTLLPLSQRLIGRCTANSRIDKINTELDYSARTEEGSTWGRAEEGYAPTQPQQQSQKNIGSNLWSNQIISHQEQIGKGTQRVAIRSPLTCQAYPFVCRLCYGWDLATTYLVEERIAVGIIAAQSIGEPGTQLTMRTFHTGGVFLGSLSQRVYAPHKGRAFFFTPKIMLPIKTLFGQGGLLLEKPTWVWIISSYLFKGTKKKIMNFFYYLSKMRNKHTSTTGSDIRISVVDNFLSNLNLKFSKLQIKQNNLLLIALGTKVYLKQTLSEPAIFKDSQSDTSAKENLRMVGKYIPNADFLAFSNNGLFSDPTWSVVETFMFYYGEDKKYDPEGIFQPVPIDLEKTLKSKISGQIQLHPNINYRRAKVASGSKNSSEAISQFCGIAASRTYGEKTLPTRSRARIKPTLQKELLLLWVGAKPQPTTTTTLRYAPFAAQRLPEGATRIDIVLVKSIIKEYLKAPKVEIMIPKTNILYQANEILYNLKNPDNFTCPLTTSSLKKKNALRSTLLNTLVDEYLSTNFVDMSFLSKEEIDFGKIKRKQIKYLKSQLLEILAEITTLVERCASEKDPLPKGAKRKRQSERGYAPTEEGYGKGPSPHPNQPTHLLHKKKAFIFCKKMKKLFLDEKALRIKLIRDNKQLLSVNLDRNYNKNELWSLRSSNDEEYFKYTQKSNLKESSLSKYELLELLDYLKTVRKDYCLNIQQDFYQAISPRTFHEIKSHLDIYCFFQSLSLTLWSSEVNQLSMLLEPRLEGIKLVLESKLLLNKKVWKQFYTTKTPADYDKQKRVSYSKKFRSKMKGSKFLKSLPTGINFRSNHVNGQEVRCSQPFWLLSSVFYDLKKYKKIYNKSTSHYPSKTLKFAHKVVSFFKKGDLFFHMPLYSPFNLKRDSHKKPTKKILEIKLGDGVNAKSSGIIVEDKKAVLIKVKLDLYLGGFIYEGSKYEPVTGQIVKITRNRCFIRVGHNYNCVPQEGEYLSTPHIYQDTGNFVTEGTALFTFKDSSKMKTQDIVQGLPKVEQLLEVRENKETLPIRNHIRLRLEKVFWLFRQKYPLIVAAKQSLRVLAQFLVDEIQYIYKSQGIDVSDKHLEIIVRNMSSMVEIDHPGPTSLLQGELVDIDKLENFLTLINIAPSNITSEEKVTLPILAYKPRILGMTQTGLKTQGFISSSSFQESKKQLVMAAVEQKDEFIQGFKLKVMLGRTI